MCDQVLCEGCGSEHVTQERSGLPVCDTCAQNNDNYSLEGNESECVARDERNYLAANG